MVGAPSNTQSDMPYFWHILLFYNQKGKNIVQTRKKWPEVYGTRTVSPNFILASFMPKMRSVSSGRPEDHKNHNTGELSNKMTLDQIELKLIKFIENCLSFHKITFLITQ